MAGKGKDTALDADDIGGSRTLVPVHEQLVRFYDDQIPAAQLAGGDIYVPLRPLTDYLGLDSSAQRRRVARDPVLSPRVREVSITATDGKQYAMLSLPLDLLPGWLFGISTSRVRDDLVEKLNRYRAECFGVLWQAFKGDVVSSSISANVQTTELSGAALALEIATAVQHLARQQLDIETRLGEVVGKQEAMANYLRSFIRSTGQRLTTLELQLSTGATVTEAQAAEIAMAVKNIGQRLATQGDRTGYARVYGELYRRYSISSYKSLPAARYDEVVGWLHGWYRELTSSG